MIRFRGKGLEEAVKEALGPETDLRGKRTKRADSVLHAWPSATLFVGASVTSLDISNHDMGGSLSLAAALWVALPGLRRLDVSRNGLRDLVGLDALKLEVLRAAGNFVTRLPRLPKSLRELDASGNALRDAEEVGRTLRELELTSLKLKGNPLRNPEALAALCSPGLEFFDGALASKKKEQQKKILVVKEDTSHHLEAHNAALEKLLETVAKQRAEHIVAEPVVVTRTTRQFVPVFVPDDRLQKCRAACLALAGVLADIDARLGIADDHLPEPKPDEAMFLDVPVRAAKEPLPAYRERVAASLAAAAALEARLSSSSSPPPPPELVHQRVEEVVPPSTSRPEAEKIEAQQKPRRGGLLLEATVVSARDLPPMKYARQTADAYVVVATGGHIRSTQIAPNSRFPEWLASFSMPAGDKVEFRVMDKTRVGPHDLIGFAAVDLRKLGLRQLRRRWLRLSKGADLPSPTTGFAARTRLSPRAALRVDLRLRETS
ncbi:hypothetical protein CTAYLR_006237 [Chrysophaeum taylorii]|uniref:C2 domain-containing protein n=1 Tax=Chrysophaeum taylorii TaxID=2483200 RepID=A0AAD7UIF4_9STRA|nr:hypothetical protein CTAYLR_006237 [Chrysophaeum taylorii]